MKFKQFIFAALLFSACASATTLSAHASTVSLGGGKTLTDATTRRVLDAAAPLLGVSSAQLYTEYQTGLVTIAYLGPIRGGHRYGVTRGNSYIITDDLIGR